MCWKKKCKYIKYRKYVSPRLGIAVKGHLPMWLNYLFEAFPVLYHLTHHSVAVKRNQGKANSYKITKLNGDGACL